ncbi:CARDB domain-containing protein [Desulfobacter latus]|uniref:CARDB domain-containing protein n=1 Tax=Desulfobacter latus TaxID=2292 RepID=A0A850TAU7_9BACT|nr:CARDB domain-containing protein [Desulfobacter latus]NWH04496.1 hypothetical protein [Desulfobacter latus]
MKKPTILSLALIPMALLCILAIGSQANPSPASEKQSVTRLTDLPHQVQEKISHQLLTAEYEVQRFDKTLPSGETATYRAFNRNQNMSAYFTGNGIHLLSNSESPSWDIEMRLSVCGYEKAQTRIQPDCSDQIFVSGHRIEYLRDGLTEWYVNDDRGVEQGVILNEPPGIKDSDPVIVTWTVSGSLRPFLEKDGTGIIFRSAKGRTVLRYSGLKAWDASGRMLAAGLSVENDTSEGGPSRISCIVDDTDAVYPVTIDPLFSQATKITAAEGIEDARFGASVSIDGNTLVVGAYGPNDTYSGPPGSAYIFYRDQGGTDTWGQVAKIMASDGVRKDYFGWSISINGDTVVVGARGDDDNGIDSGSAYIFCRDQGGADAWGQVAKITASDGVWGDYFGWSVSIDGDTVVVGANGDDDNGLGSGSAYIFCRDQGGTDAWGQAAKITASDGVWGDYFGWSVSIDGDTVVVGAPGDDNEDQDPYYIDDFGSAYIFYRDQSGTDAWGQAAKITASDGAEDDSFGDSVSIDGDTVVVGAPWDDDNDSNSGSTYIFCRDQSGTDAWEQAAKITASDGLAGDNFGRSVSIDGDTVVVGAPRDDDNGSNSGSTYIFCRDQSGIDAWGQAAKITVSDGVWGDVFGGSVSIDGDTVVVGAPGDDNEDQDSYYVDDFGSAYIFYRVQGDQPNLTPYQPNGWDDKIVVSNQTGTRTEDTIYAGETVYIDFALVNNGTADITTEFYIQLYINGIRVCNASASGLLQNYYSSISDFEYTFSSAGIYTLQLVVDANNDVDESNENDNEYQRDKKVMAEIYEGDFDNDGDVDGADLQEFIFDSGGLGLDVFAANFGKLNCP